mgnify:FL=1
MILDKNIASYTVFNKSGLTEALAKISSNSRGIVFVVDESGSLVGILTDGDFRKWLIAQTSKSSVVDLSTEVENAMNINFVFARVDDPPVKIESLLDEVIKFVPVLDPRNRIVSIARKRDKKINLGGVEISANTNSYLINSPTFVIAEVGNNHNGDLELGKRLVKESIEAGADCVKFQLRDLPTLYRNYSKANDLSEDLGSQYTLDLLERYQLENEQLFELFDYTKSLGALPLCTPWDLKSLEALEEYGMPAYKIASADMTNHELLKAVAATGKPMIVSTGMSIEKEILSAVEILKQRGAQFALLHCNSTYPAPFKDINLNYLRRIEKIGDCVIGYSGHERGFHIALAAVSLGAKIIEKHITLDKEMEGVDHKVSLVPSEFKEMVSQIRDLEAALGGGVDRLMSQGEMINRESLGKSLVINCVLKKGQRITEEMIEVRSPGKGLAIYHKELLVGKEAPRDFAPWDFFYPSDLAQGQSGARDYTFSRPFGVPVRYHDFKEISKISNLNLIEFHLSYKDLEEDFTKFIEKRTDMDFAVHCPELFANDHLLDLCSEIPAYRKRSLSELQRVVDLTRELKNYFPRTQRPLIIVNVGGFSLDTPMPKSARPRLYEKVSEGLAQLNLEGVEIIPQTMPPFPWHFGGQRHHNLFIDPGEIAEFCKKHDYRICLDISHSKLTCNHFKWSFQKFFETVGPYTAHLHIADAKGVDGEGLQIGEGDIDFPAFMKEMDRYVPDSSFIPEIWQGHKNRGEGFWIALDKLEQFSKG